MPGLQSRLFFRLISRDREIYSLKIITLAVALACTTLITLFCLNEFGYDRFHDTPESVVRIIRRSAQETISGNRLSNRIPEAAWVACQLRAGDASRLARVKIMDDLAVMSD